MDSIPIELLYYICFKLPVPSLLNLSKTSNHWSNICSDDYLWKQKALINYNIVVKNPHKTWKKLCMEVEKSSRQVKIYHNSDQDQSINITCLTTLDTLVNRFLMNNNIIILIESNNNSYGLIKSTQQLLYNTDPLCQCLDSIRIINPNDNTYNDIKFLFAHHKILRLTHNEKQCGEVIIRRVKEIFRLPPFNTLYVKH